MHWSVKPAGQALRRFESFPNHQFSKKEEANSSFFIKGPAARAKDGRVAEWLKAQSWKDCRLQKGLEGSNPSSSVALKKAPRKRGFCFSKLSTEEEAGFPNNLKSSGIPSI